MPKIHCIGIGGIGVSALARYFIAKGYRISGSDLAESEITKALEEEGAKVFIGPASGEHITEDVDQVIYSAAISLDNPELVRAKELGIHALSYAQKLGELTRDYFTIAVSGTHGKSTTTSMLALIMIEAGLDPTVIVGTRLPELGGTNFRLGKSRYLVIEADEYDRTFWNYQPRVAVITNIEADHLDTYGDLEGVVEGFNHYLKNLRRDAVAVVNAQDENVSRALEGVQCKLAFFNEVGVKPNWPLAPPGDFNQLNAEAAWRAAEILDVDRSVAERALAKFKGTWRRLEPLEPVARDKYPADTLFFSDYGHHPTEIKVTLEAVKSKYPDRKLTVIFQPHQVRRLINLFKEFTQAFESADYVHLLPVYQVAGREGQDGKSSKDLFEALKERSSDSQVFYDETLEDTLAHLEKGVVVFMGAGDIDAKVRQHFKSDLLPNEKLAFSGQSRRSSVG